MFILLLDKKKKKNYRCPEYLPKQPSKLEETMVGLRLFLYRRRALCSYVTVQIKELHLKLTTDDRSHSFACSHSADAPLHFLRSEHDDRMKKRTFKAH